MDILAGTLVDILAEERLVTCKHSMDIIAELFTGNLYLYYYLGSLKLSTDTVRVCLVLFNCTDNGFNLKPDIVHVDFEESMMKVIRSIFPATNIKCCRFHLGQAW
jgi:hypothetical protein